MEYPYKCTGCGKKQIITMRMEFASFDRTFPHECGGEFKRVIEAPQLNVALCSYDPVRDFATGGDIEAERCGWE